MASRDVLNLSLDDIIRMRRRGSYNRQNGAPRYTGAQKRGGAPSRSANLGWTRTGIRGRGRGRARGARLLSTKFTVQRGGGPGRGRGVSALRNRGNKGVMIGPGRGQTGQARRRGGAYRGRGRGVHNDRSGRASYLEAERQTANTRRGRGSLRGLRGAGNSSILKRGQGGIIQRSSIRQQHLVRQRNHQNITAVDSFRQKLVRRKIQQARKTLVLSQQNNRAKARLNIVNAKRGIQDGLSSPVRGAGSVVSLSSQHGLTVSIRNNIASNHTHHGFPMKMRPRLNRGRLRQQAGATSYAPAMFTLTNDQASPPEPPITAPLPTRKILKRNVTSSREQRGAVTSPVADYSQQSAHSVPEPHRQILDHKVQKEIAMLQGKEVSLNNGPGPGVKGFRHIPSYTTRSLNERFTEDHI